MKNTPISDSDCRTFTETFAGTDKGIYILWKCKENITIGINTELFPEEKGDPLEYLRDEGYVEGTSLSAYNMFCRRVRERIAEGGGCSRLSTDVSLKLPEMTAYRLFHITVLFSANEYGKIVSTVISISPYSERQIAERAVIDIFTSDKAPEILGARIRRMMDRNADRGIAFVQFDVERFKLINDTYGIERGDALLRYFMEALGTICTDDQPFSRLSADVFMIIIAFDEESEIVDFVHKVEETIGNSYGGIEFRLSFGVAIAEDKTLHTRRHGDNATIARKAIKGNALNNIGFYNGSLKSELYKQHHIEDDMENAILNNEFIMYLQPKYSISTGRIIGAEALARWVHPTRGIIPPSEFVSIFEKNGFIVKLDQVIWEHACRKIRYWLDNGIEPVPISVNISREYLGTFDVVGKFKELIAKYDIPISLLEAEITESYDAEDTTHIVTRMKEMGFTMLMDDFGSGYSSLNMLKTTPFDVLKIDRLFLSEFMESDRGRKIIEHTIAMTRDIGLDVIAEGVENIEQANFLKKCGCDTVQGFYYSKPVSEEEFEEKRSTSAGNVRSHSQARSSSKGK